jgi:hypothetical protein
VRRTPIWAKRVAAVSGQTLELCPPLGPIRPRNRALARQLCRSLFLVIRAREGREESDKIVDIILGQRERLYVFVEIGVLQAVAFVVMVDHSPKRLLRTIVKIRSGHQHVAYVRRLERSRRHSDGHVSARPLSHHQEGNDSGGIARLDELLGLSRQRDDIVPDDTDADVVKVVIREEGDVPLGFRQRVTFIATRLAVKELPAVLGRFVDGVIPPAMKRSKGESNDSCVRS